MARSIFALELCARLEPTLRARIHQLIRLTPGRTGPSMKFELYRALSAAWRESLHLVERGCWDFFDDDDRATRDFTMWSQGMATEEGVRTSPSGAFDPYRGEPRYMTFTTALLLQRGSYAERMLANTCKIPEPQLWQRPTFARMIEALSTINFGSVEADVVYLIPGDDSWGLTVEDLAHRKFQYLRPVT